MMNEQSENKYIVPYKEIYFQVFKEISNKKDLSRHGCSDATANAATVQTQSHKCDRTVQV